MTGAYQLLLIDDDLALGHLLVEYLARFGHYLETTNTASQGWRYLQQRLPDLVILDLMLPDKDGLSMCREIRREFDVPIIMLTARGEVADRILGLELGADDYVPKPFEPRELVARIDTVLRRGPSRSVTAKMVAGPLMINPLTREVFLKNQAIDLSSTEFELLIILMECRGRVLNRDQLLLKLRGQEGTAFDRSIDMLISRLRQKLGDSSRAPIFIKTVWGTGYKFTLPVRREK